MCKSEIFAETLKFVSSETEISSERILSSSKETEVVDARNILVNLLFKKGFYPSEIALFCGKSKRCINIIISSFDKRVENGKMLGILWEKIGNISGI